VDNSAFRRVISALNPATLARHWQLTNTKYIFVPGNGAVDVLNQYLDPVQRRFRVAQRFDIVPKKNIPGGQPRTYMDFTAQLNPAGQVAMIEFTGALPRAKLYSNWQVNTNRDSTLATLADPAFDPIQTVVVGDPIPGPDATNTNQPPGAAEINPNYEPKRVEITADAKVPSVLLLNDKYNSNWHVTVDGKPAQLLRCNWVMRGVSLQPGKHDIVFLYTLTETTLYLSISAVVMALGLCLWLAVDKTEGQSNGANPPPAPNPPGNPAR
jgi:hypothetical protein